ncbi:hypothetical protein ACFWNL_34145 [Kitasatospora sp. NPDC058397]|uniref:hypothetical protein n=1 Tax=unclassified Kitasatospora TaxID=2633591 RepID=UPI003654DEF2
MTAFNERLGRIFRVRDLHELLGLPVDEPSIDITAPAWDDSFVSNSSTNPGAAATGNGLLTSARQGEPSRSP